jgi:hypothetical protein
MPGPDGCQPGCVYSSTFINMKGCNGVSRCDVCVVVVDDGNEMRTLVVHTHSFIAMLSCAKNEPLCPICESTHLSAVEIMCTMLNKTCSMGFYLLKLVKLPLFQAHDISLTRNIGNIVRRVAKDEINEGRVKEVQTLVPRMVWYMILVRYLHTKLTIELGDGKSSAKARCLATSIEANTKLIEHCYESLAFAVFSQPTETMKDSKAICTDVNALVDSIVYVVDTKKHLNINVIHILFRLCTSPDLSSHMFNA